MTEDEFLGLQHIKLNVEIFICLQNHGNPTSHKPELILTNFTTRLGHRIGRLIQSLFPQDPNFRGRRVVNFHNQRDFIFFCHHRYIFETKEMMQSNSNGISPRMPKMRKYLKRK
uniref:Brix domain-containing protein n=1 Tax=Nelumbo nucifera TaxID=4432 RepID=A0A822XZR5_NELNU|nr:TPA_asm: hypothetical protein HUJ06_026165 [Nelumbo nucifera]